MTWHTCLVFVERSLQSSHRRTAYLGSRFSGRDLLQCRDHSTYENIEEVQDVSSPFTLSLQPQNCGI